MSHPISLTSEHLITSILLQRVQMGVPDGTSADWGEALIGCLWLSGRWSRVIILSLGGDMLTSYLAHFSPPLFSPFSHLFIALHLHIQPLHQPAAAASSLLPPHLPLSCAQLSDPMNTSHYCSANDWFKWLLVAQTSVSCQMQHDKDMQSQPGLYLCILVNRYRNKLNIRILWHQQHISCISLSHLI